jgi:hypothetical protein
MKHGRKDGWTKDWWLAYKAAHAAYCWTLLYGNVIAAVSLMEDRLD